jgi:hypothetical protein
MTTLLPIPHRPTATDEDVVDEIFHQLWFEFGAQLGDYAFFSRNIPPLVAAYGHDAVAAALRRHHAQIRSAASDQIRQLRQHAARLKRERSAVGDGS